MPTTMTYTGELTVVRCTTDCGITFAIPKDLYHEARYERPGARGRSIFCPLGHSWHYIAKSETDELRERLAQEERRSTARLAAIDRARAEAEHQRNVANGYKGALAKSKKRSAKGVCPVPGCKRHFANVERHVASKHAGWLAENHEAPSS